MKDTTFQMGWEEYLEAVLALGFRAVLSFSFEIEGREEQFMVFWHDSGVLLRCDSCFGRRNSANIYFNLWYEKYENVWDIQYTGHVNAAENVVIGSMDARVGIVHIMDSLYKAGVLIKPWIERPFLWLLHYGETRDPNCDYKAINETRLAQLPEFVRINIPADMEVKEPAILDK
jgi:hypothetical protein